MGVSVDFLGYSVLAMFFARPLTKGHTHIPPKVQRVIDKGSMNQKEPCVGINQYIRLGKSGGSFRGKPPTQIVRNCGPAP